MSNTVATNFEIRNVAQAELKAIIELVQLVDLDEFGETDFTEGDVQEEWVTPGFDLEKDAWAVYNTQNLLIGYASLSHAGELASYCMGFVRPDFYGQGIGPMLVRLAETRARECLHKAPPEGRVTINNFINGRNKAARNLLEREGYNLARTFWRMRIDLEAEPAEPQWPEGITFRNMQPETDAFAVYEAVEEAFSDHWGHLPRPFEEWKETRINVPSFDPALWVLALDSNNTVAAFSLGKFTSEGGWINTLGTRRAWRGKGLGKAVLQQAFLDFYRLGKKRVELSVDSDSLTGATKLYEKAGMQAVHEYARFTKVLRDGPELSTQSL